MKKITSMSMMYSVKILSRFLLAYVLAGVVGALGKEKYQTTEGDLCATYKSCSACTEAHYNAQQTTTDEIVQPELRATNNNNFIQGQKRLLRRGNITKIKKNETLDWPHRRPTCIWCPKSETCTSKHNIAACITDRDASGINVVIQYEYNCPLGPIPYPNDPPSLLPDWMGALLETGSLNNLTLVDWSLPGTHDSLTYDLSLTVSEGDAGEMKVIEALLHKLSGGTIKLLPGELEDFFRLQAKTQQLTVQQQLDNGIRFIDFRLMMENNHHTDAWYSIHFMQSKQNVLYYFQQIRDWMNLHPNEIVVIWLSKHGSTSATGNNQYPDVTPEQKQELWRQYMDIFEGLILDSRVSCIHKTPIKDLIHRDHRLITFASDYEEFTGLSPFALDAAHIQNFVKGDGVFHEFSTMQANMKYLANADTNNRDIWNQGGFSLMGMNTEGTSWQIKAAAKHRFLHWFKKNLEGKELEMDTVELFSSCSSHIKIPGVSRSWCPETLLDISQLSSFYNQIAIETTSRMIEQEMPGFGFPNAFYLDGLDYDGTIRTGTQLLNGSERSAPTASHKTSRYAYVDTLLAYNIRKACASESKDFATDKQWTCYSLAEAVSKRKAKYPLEVWEQPEYGRHADWPLV